MFFLKKINLFFYIYWSLVWTTFWTNVIQLSISYKNDNKKCEKYKKVQNTNERLVMEWIVWDESVNWWWGLLLHEWKQRGPPPCQCHLKRVFYHLYNFIISLWIFLSFLWKEKLGRERMMRKRSEALAKV